MNPHVRTGLSIGGVAIAAVTGVFLASQLLLGEAMSTTIKNAAVSGVIASVMFAAEEYVRRT